MFKKECHKFLSINKEFIEAYSNIVDEKMILSVTKNKVKEYFNISEIEIFYFEEDSYIALDSAISIGNSSRLINWLYTNNLTLSLKSNVDKYVKEDLVKLSLQDNHYIFPLTNLNKILAFAVVKFNKKIEKDTILFLENIFSLCVLSYDNAIRSAQQRDNYRRDKETSNLSVIRKMVSVLAHEIKNPLTSIRSSIQYISKSSKNDVIKELSSDLISEVDRISDITKQMLDKSNPQLTKITNYDIIEIINHFMRVNKSWVDEQQVELRLVEENRELLQEVLIDQDAIIGIFSNLLKNSLEAIDNNNNAFIEILVKYNNNSLTVSWLDNGVGISRENMKSIFEPFFSTKRKGYGLGLAFCRRLLKGMGSDLQVTSNPGNGTRFYFELMYRGINE